MSRGDGEAIPEDDEDRDGLDVKKKKKSNRCKNKWAFGSPSLPDVRSLLGRFGHL